MEHKLKETWDKTLDVLGISKSSKSEFVFETIINTHSQESRYYHNTNHLFMMIDKINTLSNIYSIGELNRYIMIYSAFFHDFIHFPNKTKEFSDEEMSALSAVEYLNDMGNDSINIIQQVYDLITCTKEHKVNLESSVHIILQEIFIDSDLAIFAVDRKVYKKYTENIRNEYIHVSEQLYISKRYDFLMLKTTGNIYHTVYMQETYGKLALENIYLEMSQLPLS